VVILSCNSSYKNCDYHLNSSELPDREQRKKIEVMNVTIKTILEKPEGLFGSFGRVIGHI
jgi:hypothetical protein